MSATVTFMKPTIRPSKSPNMGLESSHPPVMRYVLSSHRTTSSIVVRELLHVKSASDRLSSKHESDPRVWEFSANQLLHACRKVKPTIYQTTSG